MPRQTKYHNEYFIQYHCPGVAGWEDVCDYDKRDRQERKDAWADLKEYRFGERNGGGYRMITRRVLNDADN